MAKEAAWLGTMTWAIMNPSANISARMNHRFVVTEIWVSDQHAQREAEQASGDVTARADARVDEAAGELRADHDAERLGEGGETRLQSGQPAGVLEVERDEVQHPEEGRRGEEHDGRWSSGTAAP